MANRPGVSDTARRTWDEAAYAQRARLRETQQTDTRSGRKSGQCTRDLEWRNPSSTIDYEALAGSSVVVPNGASKRESGGFYCEACEVLLHDSSAYINHINGRAHHAVIGVSLQVKPSTAADVRAAFNEAHRRKTANRTRRPRRTLEERLQARSRVKEAKPPASGVIGYTEVPGCGPAEHSSGTTNPAAGTRPAERAPGAEGPSSVSRVERNTQETVMEQMGLPTAFK